ncbi:MAG TPA: hypothetical protein VGT61_07805 [Thermomicrobiales bacterium]|jgi:hypothetical protein|nr:hypothetical protein [Thermomicrobiales bacterium]
MSVFGVSLLDLLLLTFCFSVPFAVLAVIVTVLYRRDRRLTPPEPDARMPSHNPQAAPARQPGDERTRGKARDANPGPEISDRT